MNYKIPIILIFIVLSTSKIYAQNNNDIKEKLPLKERFFFGGNLGLQLGSYTYIEIAPLSGIHLTPSFDVGIGGIYTYSKNTISQYKTQTYGLNTYSQLTIFKPIIAHVQAEILNADYMLLSGEIKQDWFESVLVGGGIKQAIGPKSYSFVLILWNLNTSYISPYQNPVIKVGIIF